MLVYYDMYAIRPGWLEHQPAVELIREKTASYSSGSKGLHEAWEPVYENLANEIKVRHYSPKTLKAYRNWVRKFQQFLKGKSPEGLSVDDVKDFLTFLAVEQKVSASSQNQAFNALLFFFRHILGEEFGKVEGVVRAKRKPYIPVVLSRTEIDRIIDKLRYPYSLVVKFLYGCGLRLGECMNIRINNFNLDMGVLTIHDGKGKKDRTVPLPLTIIPEINRQFEIVRKIHRQDLEEETAGVFMFESIVNRTQLTKRATAHTFRHSFASHLLQANYV